MKPPIHIFQLKRRWKRVAHELERWVRSSHRQSLSPSSTEAKGGATADLRRFEFSRNKMALIRPWVRSDLRGVFEFGGKGTVAQSSPSRRLRGQMKKQHVQCIEVEEKHNALKINDSETSVWCFVSTPGMEEVRKQTIYNSSYVLVPYGVFRELLRLIRVLCE